LVKSAANIKKKNHLVYYMPKTLVIILAETREYELTFDNFKQNVIDTLNADLCLCIGVKPNYNYNNPFYKLAKYKFSYDEPNDFGNAFDYAYDILSKENREPNPLHWREFLKIPDQFMGGIKDSKNQHPGSAGILVFFRWFLLKNLIEHDLINKYDRFIITRSDFIYNLPHPKVELMDENSIWVPNSEHYGGYTDRHVVLSKNNIEKYLNILNNFVLRSNEYFSKMKKTVFRDTVYQWNLERLIKFNLEQNNVLSPVKEFPYIMYSIRNINGTSRWQMGTYSDKLGYYIKYQNEYIKSCYYKNKFEKSFLTIDEFYKQETMVATKGENLTQIAYTWNEAFAALKRKDSKKNLTQVARVWDEAFAALKSTRTPSKKKLNNPMSRAWDEAFAALGLKDVPKNTQLPKKLSYKDKRTI